MRSSSILVISFVFFVTALPAHGNWSTSSSKDEMTGEPLAFATSATSWPTRRMEFPYSDVNAWLGVGCDGSQEWAYIGFNQKPNIANTDTKRGYQVLKTRIKWDDEVRYSTLTQEWGATFLHFLYDEPVIEDIGKFSAVLIELNWYGEGRVYFNFSLEGSSAALKSIREKCGKR